ncbi:MAG: hypothetical protein ACO2ZM_00595 [Francisellaceae bacterium]
MKKGRKDLGAKKCFSTRQNLRGFGLLESMLAIVCLGGIMLGFFMLNTTKTETKRLDIVAQELSVYVLAVQKSAPFMVSRNTVDEQGYQWLSSQSCQNSQISWLPCDFSINTKFFYSKKNYLFTQIIPVIDSNDIKIRIIIGDFYNKNIPSTQIANQVLQQLKTRLMLLGDQAVMTKISLYGKKKSQIAIDLMLYRMNAKSMPVADPNRIWLRLDGKNTMRGRIAFNTQVPEDKRRISGVNDVQLLADKENNTAYITSYGFSGDNRAPLRIQVDSASVITGNTQIETHDDNGKITLSANALNFQSENSQFIITHDTSKTKTDAQMKSLQNIALTSHSIRLENPYGDSTLSAEKQITVQSQHLAVEDANNLTLKGKSLTMRAGGDVSIGSGADDKVTFNSPILPGIHQQLTVKDIKLNKHEKSVAEQIQQYTLFKTFDKKALAPIIKRHDSENNLPPKVWWYDANHLRFQLSNVSACWRLAVGQTASLFYNLESRKYYPRYRAWNDIDIYGKLAWIKTDEHLVPLTVSTDAATGTVTISSPEIKYFAEFGPLIRDPILTYAKWIIEENILDIQIIGHINIYCLKEE